MANLAALTVDLRTNTAKFAQGMNDANRKLDKFSRSVNKTRNLLIGAFATGAVVNFVKHSIAATDKIGKMSAAVGLSAEAFQELRFAAEQAGVENASFNSIMTAFVKRVGEAKSGTGALTTFLKKNNEETLNQIINAKSQEEALSIVASTMGGMASETDRAAFAAAAFSRQGVIMTGLLRDGGKSMANLRQQARDLGIILDNKVVANAEDANDKLNILEKTISARLTRAVVDNASELATFAENMTTIATETAKAVNSLISLFNLTFNPPKSVQIERLKTLRDNLIADLAKPRLLRLHPFMSEEEFQAEIDKLNTQIATLESEPRTIKITPKLTGGGAGFPGMMTPEQMEAQAEMYKMGLDRITEDFRNAARERQQIEQSLSATILDMRLNVASQTAGLISMLGGENKNAARIALGIETAIAAKRILIQSSVAAAAALTPPPIGLGPVAGQVLAGKILAAGKLSAALTGISGLVSLSKVGSAETPSSGGGGDGGGGGITPSPSPIQQRGGERTIQIYFQGGINGVDDIKQAVADAIKDAESSNMIIFSGPNGERVRPI